ncbi:MAG: hypothetical protein ACREF8_04495, partial [Chthoniobacterales bacterium]
MFFSLLGSATLFHLGQLLEIGLVADRLPNGINFSASDVEKEEAPNLQLQLRLLFMEPFALNRSGCVADGRYKSSERRDRNQVRLVGKPGRCCAAVT